MLYAKPYENTFTPVLNKRSHLGGERASDDQRRPEATWLHPQNAARRPALDERCSMALLRAARQHRLRAAHRRLPDGRSHAGHFEGAAPPSRPDSFFRTACGRAAGSREEASGGPPARQQQSRQGRRYVYTQGYYCLGDCRSFFVVISRQILRQSWWIGSCDGSLLPRG